MKQILPVLLFTLILKARTEEYNAELDFIPYSKENYLEEKIDDQRHSYFFNGSYKVSDVLNELANNRSLTEHVKKRMKREECATSHLYGGSGGSIFQDPCSSNIGGVIIRSGGIIDSIQAVYSNQNNMQWTPVKHGGSGGTKKAIIFYRRESIIAVVGSYGRSYWCNNCINELGFITENENGLQEIHGPFGSKKGSLLLCVGKVAGFFGRSGKYLDAIGCYYS